VILVILLKNVRLAKKVWYLMKLAWNASVKLPKNLIKLLIVVKNATLLKESASFNAQKVP